MRLRFRVNTLGIVPAGEPSLGYWVDNLTIAEKIAAPTPTPTASAQPPVNLPTLRPSTTPTATATPVATATETAPPSPTPTELEFFVPTATEEREAADRSAPRRARPLPQQRYRARPLPLAAPLNQGGSSTETTINYTYDGVYRLTNAKYCDGLLTPAQCDAAQAARSYAYTYDLGGNRLSQAVFDGTSTVTTNYAYNLANQITSDGTHTFTYDLNGNLTDDGLNAYTYDAANRLKTFTPDGGSATSYFYNGDGARYRQTTSGVNTDYLLDLTGELTQVLGEFAPGDTTYYLLGLDIIGQQNGSAWSYFGYDGLGSVRQLYDASGNVGYAASYDPYGVPLSQTGSLTSPLGFTGEYTDPSGLIYLRARYMHPALGAFLTRDPVLGQVGGGSVRWNSYLYVHANPINFVDPSGKFVNLGFGLFGAIVGALISGGSYLLGRIVDNLQNNRCPLININLDDLLHSVAIGATVGFVGGITFGVGLGVGTSIGTTLGITSGNGFAASLLGFVTVAGAGVAAGQTSRLAGNILTGHPIVDRLLNPKDMLVDAVLSVILFKVFGADYRQIAPADYTTVGPFGKESIPSTGSRTTPAQRRDIQPIGDLRGCHTCGARTPGGANNVWIADHVPPTNSTNPPTSGQPLYPQCFNCSATQGGLVSQGLDAILPNHIWNGRWFSPGWIPLDIQQ